MTNSGRPHPFAQQKESFEEKRIRKKIKFLRILLVLFVFVFAYGVSGAVYTLMSNHAHVSFSFDTGKPIFAVIIPGATNVSAVNFTVRVMNTNSAVMQNLFINITIDQHPPNATMTSFQLNGIPAANQFNPQWIANGPFSLDPNKPLDFSMIFGYSGLFGYYDIDASILQLS